jgi:perosamine synthetase
VPDAVRHSSPKVIFESYPELGFNYRMTDIQGAIGREQLKRIPNSVLERRQMADRYRELLSDIPGLILPFEPEWARTNWQSYCVRLPEDLNQRRAMQSLLNEGVATRRGIMCTHLEAAYRSPDTWHCGDPECGHSNNCRHLALSELAQNTGVILPLFSEMTNEQQDHVVSALHQACTVGSHA